MSTYVIAFESTHAAMAASRALEAAGTAFRTIPTPRAISAGCGIALMFDADDPAPVLAVVRGDGSTTAGAALFRKDGAAAFERLCAV